MSAIGFACNQTPIRFTDTFDLSGISSRSNEYGNAGSRLWTLESGNGLIANPYDKSGGIYIDENIQNSFTLNGVTYNLYDMRILHGHHAIYKWVDISGQSAIASPTDGSESSLYRSAPLEIYIFFKNNMNQILALVLPIGVVANQPANTTYAAKYLKSLNTTPGGPRPPLLSTLFQDLSGATTISFTSNNAVLQYIGQDIRTVSTCDSTSLMNPITYLVIMNDTANKIGTRLISSTINVDEYNALIGKVSPAPTLTLGGSHMRIDSSAGTLAKLTFIPSGSLYITNSNTGVGSSSVNTSAVKCYPVNPSKNIKNGQLYLDKDGVPISLADELAPPPSESISIPSSPSFFTTATGIETIIAGLIALFIFCIMLYILLVYNYPTFTSTVASTGSDAVEGIKSIPSAIITSVYDNRTIITGIGVILFVIVMFTWAITMTVLWAKERAAHQP